jgi:uncharacterized protein
VNDHPSATRLGVLDGIGLVLWTQLAQILVVALVVMVGVDLATQPAGVSVVLVAQVVTLGGALLWIRGRRVGARELWGPAPMRPVHVVVGIAGGFGGTVLASTTITVLTSLTGPVEPPQQSLRQLLVEGDATAAALATIAAVVLAPVVEEVVFRGALFRATRDRFGFAAGALLSAGIFALVHVELRQPVYSVSLLVLGLWLAWLLERTRTLWVPMLAHATFNSVTVVAALLQR